MPPIPPIHPRIRILIIIILSFALSGLLMSYTEESPQDGTPTIQVQNIASDFSRSISDSGTNILSTLQSIRIPSLISFSPSVPEDPVDAQPEPTPDEWLTEPTVPPEPPTSTPAILHTIAPTRPPFISQTPPKNPTARPTTPPQPTKTPKPTKVPKPTEAVYPPINDDTRPGDSLDEILHEVEKRACVPYALLMAIKTTESGASFKTANASTIKMYNTYGWWKTASLADTCGGFGYHTQTGLVAPDSPHAGQKCSSPIGNPTDIKIMGILQISEWEQEVTRKNTIKTLPKNIDRRVLFDNALIFAWATRGRAGNSPQPSCTDWPEETVKLVAEKHHGVCKYDYGNGAAGNYCTKIWELYRSFK